MSFELNNLKKGSAKQACCQIFWKKPQIKAFLITINIGCKLKVEVKLKSNVLSSHG
jgi:hypothetical protein